MSIQHTRDLELKHQTILILGAGNMGGALAKGLTQAGIPGENILVHNRSPEKAWMLKEHCDITPVHHLSAAIQQADIILLAVKPKDIQALCQRIQKELPPHVLIISVATAIPCDRLQAFLHTQAIIRAMPNTPSRVGAGMTMIYAPPYVPPSAIRLAQQLFQTVGKTMMLNHESEINTTMAVAGCGPAYVFLFIEALTHAALRLGVTPAQAKQLITQTLSGTAKLYEQSEHTAQTLKTQVAPKGGTTQAALDILQSTDWHAVFESALCAAYQRAIQIEAEITS
jgi:pyrroline-5-carboxylate reductase